MICIKSFSEIRRFPPRMCENMHLSYYWRSPKKTSILYNPVRHAWSGSNQIFPTNNDNHLIINMILDISEQGKLGLIVMGITKTCLDSCDVL